MHGRDNWSSQARYLFRAMIPAAATAKNIYLMKRCELRLAARCRQRRDSFHFSQLYAMLPRASRLRAREATAPLLAEHVLRRLQRREAE